MRCTIYCIHPQQQPMAVIPGSSDIDPTGWVDGIADYFTNGLTGCMLESSGPPLSEHCSFQQFCQCSFFHEFDIVLVLLELFECFLKIASFYCNCRKPFRPAQTCRKRCPSCWTRCTTRCCSGRSMSNGHTSWRPPTCRNWRLRSTRSAWLWSRSAALPIAKTASRRNRPSKLIPISLSCAYCTSWTAFFQNR